MTATNLTYLWRFVAKDTQQDEDGFWYGHSFWRDLNTGRVSICDMSGGRPDLTDDGVLWVNMDKPWVLTDRQGKLRVDVPLLDADERPTGTFMCGYDGVRIAQKLGAQIKVDATSDIGKLLPLIRSYHVE